MLNLITGTPGSGKTLYAVFLIDKFETANKRALDYNATVFKTNLELIEKHDLKDYFSSYTYFNKITKEYETVIFEPDHFNYFLEKQRTEGVFLDIKFYNGILENIRKELDVQLKTLKEVRHIYANIDGLKVDLVRPIEIDWRKCPDGSIIFYDEIQLIPEYSNDNKQDKDGIIKYLTVHRHRAFDIYGITQFPRLVNPGFRDVVGLHYHLHRGWGAPSATVYVWANCRDKPNSLGNKLTAERDFRFNYPKRLYQVYESATANTVRLRVPLKLFAILLIPLLGLMMVISMFTNGSDNFLVSIFSGGKDKPVEVKKETSTSQQTTKQSADQQAKQLTNPDLECRKAENVDLPECKQWFDNLTKTNGSVQPMQVMYNPNKPYDFQPDSVPIQIVDYPRLSGCARDLKGHYVGIDQQGNIMPKVAQSDCKKWIDGQRLFDYTKPRNVQVSNNANGNNQVNSTDNHQPSIESLAKIEQMNQPQRSHASADTMTTQEINHGFG